MNRRTFIGKSLWAIIGFGVISPSLGLGSYRKGPVKPNRDLQRYRFDKTIFCQFDNSTLKVEIEKLAKELGCRVYSGEPGSFDIIGVPYFISVVDRSLVGRQAWETYMQYCRVTGDQTPCLIINGRDGLEFPTQRNFILISPNDTKKTAHIKDLIAGARPR
jgi:hypothetical protein